MGPWINIAAEDIMIDLYIIARVAQFLLAVGIVAGIGCIFEYGYYFA